MLITLVWPRPVGVFVLVAYLTTHYLAFQSADERRPAEVLALEKQERWREAAEYYELKSREVPDHPETWSGEVRRCRFQARLKQRSESPVLREHLNSLSFFDAIELYSSLLELIKTQACEARSMQQLFLQGLADLNWALENPAFCRLAFPGRLDDVTLQGLRVELKLRWRGQAIPNRVAAIGQLQALVTRWQREYAARPAPLVYIFLQGACAAVDEYSAYLPPFWRERETLATRGNVATVGLAIGQNRDDLVVQALAPQGAAVQMGLTVNAQLLAIDGQPASTLTPDEAELLLLGPAGSRVLVEWQGAMDAAPRSAELTRQRLNLPSVSGARMVDESRGIACVQILLFDESTAAELDASLSKLRASGMKALIIDLRGNPGGLLSAAAAVAARFLPHEAVAFSTHGRDGQGVVRYAAVGATPMTVPLVVLLDHDTASAAEALAAALEDQLWAVTVGETTWGKGTVQHLLPIGRGGAGVRLSTARWMTSRNQDLQNVGLRPKWPVTEFLKLEPGPETASALTVAQRQLEVAIRAAREMLQSP